MKIKYKIAVIALIVAWTSVPVPAAPTVSNVRVAVTSTVRNGNFWNWYFEVTFDLANTNGNTCRIWPGIKVGDNGYWMYWNLTGDTAAAAGAGKKIQFMVKDTGDLKNCRVKITAWDRESWPPLPNKPFFPKYHHWALDIRSIPKFHLSDSIMHFNKRIMEKNMGIEVVGSIGLGMPVFRVMGNHPLERGIPIPKISFGDPADAYNEGGGWACKGDDHMTILDVEGWKLHEFFQMVPVRLHQRLALLRLYRMEPGPGKIYLGLQQRSGLSGRVGQCLRRLRPADRPGHDNTRRSRRR